MDRLNVECSRHPGYCPSLTGVMGCILADALMLCINIQFELYETLSLFSPCIQLL